MKYNLVKTSLPNWSITKELSNNFSMLLFRSLGKETIKKINNINKTEVDFCASHKFCDANQYMIKSLNNLFGENWSLSDQRIINLINDAWELSILNNFKIKGIQDLGK